MLHLDAHYNGKKSYSFSVTAQRLLVILFIGLFGNAYAQPNPTTNNTIAKNSKSNISQDTVYLKHKRKLSQLSSTQDFLKLATTQKTLAQIAQKKNKWQLSVSYFGAAAKHYLMSSDTSSAIICLRQQAISYSAYNNIDSAFVTYNRALDLARNTNNLYLNAQTNLQFTAWLHQQTDYKEALHYSANSIAFTTDLKNDTLLAQAQYLHGFALMRTGALKQAIGYFNMSQNTFKKLGDYNGQALVLNAIADLMAQEEKWLIAFNNYRKSLELMAFSQNYKYMYRTYINFAGLLIQLSKQPEHLAIFDNETYQDEYKAVKTYLTMGVFWAKQQRNLEFQVIGYKYLKQVYLNEKNYEVGLRLVESYDSVRELAHLQQRIKIEEIKRLHDNRRKDIVIHSLERDKKVSELKSERNKLINYLLATFIIILFVIVISAYLRSRERKAVTRQILRKNIEIEKQKKTLQEQNQELVAKNQMIEKQKNALQNALSELESTQTKLVQSERLASIYQLTSGLIHEINNPVNAISGGVQSLTLLLSELNSVLRLVVELDQQKTIDDIVLKIIEAKDMIFLKEVISDIQQLMQSINNGTERTHAIINSLKIFNRLDDEKFESANVNTIVIEVSERLKQQHRESISITAHLEDLPKVQCYPELIRLALDNIVNNAVLAINNKEGSIVFSTKLDNKKSVCISIKDNGCGMDQKTLGRVFEPFFSTRPIGKGTGLGLAIAHGIIQKHRGSLKANSTPSEGAEFTICIPIV